MEPWEVDGQAIKDGAASKEPATRRKCGVEAPPQPLCGAAQELIAVLGACSRHASTYQDFPLRSRRMPFHVPVADSSGSPRAGGL